MIEKLLLVVTLACAPSASGCGDKNAVGERDASEKNDGDKNGAGKEDGGAASCGQLIATLDGKPIEGLAHGLGTKSAAGYTIEVFNHDKTTCEVMLAESRQVPDGEKSIRVNASDDGGGLGYANNTRIGNVSVSLKTAPTKPGDPMAICVSGSLKLGMGNDKGKTLAVEGMATGTYCGERE